LRLCERRFSGRKGRENKMNNLPSPGRRNTYLLMPDPMPSFLISEGERCDYEGSALREE
jgi:hypothetical protein